MAQRPDATLTGYQRELDSSAGMRDTSEDMVDGMGVLSFGGHQTSGYFGPSSISAFSRQIQQTLHQTLGHRDSTNLTNIGRQNFHRFAPTATPSIAGQIFQLNDGSVDIMVLPPENEVVRLVDLYFSRTGILFPYIHKQSILSGLADLKAAGVGGMRRSWLSLLNTMMAFGLTLALDSKRNEYGASKAEQCLQRALSLLPDVQRHPINLETLQALILLAQYLQGIHRSVQAYSFLGLTVQAAFQIGAYLPGQQELESMLEYQIRKRCWYMCFILDRAFSMRFGRPPLIHSDYNRMSMPSDVDLEQIEDLTNPQLGRTPSTTSGFIHNIRIARFVDEIIHEVYQDNIPNDVGSSLDEMIPEIVRIESNMHAWKKTLPPNMQIKSRADMRFGAQHASDSFQLSLTLTLHYLNARTLLHRAVLPFFLNLQRSKDEDGGLYAQSFAIPSIEHSVASATEIIEILYDVSQSGQRVLMAWWFSLYFVFNSALVVFAAIIIQHHHSLNLPCLDPMALRHSFNKAIQAVEVLGDKSDIASRCETYLQNLLRGVSSFGSRAGDAAQESETRDAYAFIDQGNVDSNLLDMTDLELEYFAPFYT
ncbi:uncharacterized protein Z520_06384 [Fonsecaea multimorphosa CBS 102226]|uniref:Xylanolytic transcriptional activator regulatory domain-containing protein n=1 Tax=Fonsecaea multimorphosa CBS 102226 TaxID=1442371 RepID=A0A0D2IKR2_9EURO|nr:uncharacterized protein Z520_06384 [Fonsecaea multimorphosa CBS 102226]KIX97606.1 hypothetical protein Z520_06384 [Fonsecaea multimorphosa CBS 102226]OAL24071.1 hypothetical protein AYO22_05952 [Fonsecaea multimorphosa]